MSTATRREQGGNSNGNNPGRFRSNQPSTHTHGVRGLDSYPTPRIAVESLGIVQSTAGYSQRSRPPSPPTKRDR